MLRSLFLVLVILGGLAWGAGPVEEAGILAHACPEDAIILVGESLKTFHPDRGLARKLTERGVGGRWRLFTQGDKLQSAIYMGPDASVVAALAAQRRFIDLVNKSKFAEAFAMQTPPQQGREPLGPFTTNYHGRYLSCHPEDLKVTLARSQLVTIKVKLQLTTTATSSMG